VTYKAERKMRCPKLIHGSLTVTDEVVTKDTELKPARCALWKEHLGNCEAGATVITMFALIIKQWCNQPLQRSMLLAEREWQKRIYSREWR
jgi:hypothetical protein